MSKERVARRQIDDLKVLCESDLYSFGEYINPQYVYGDIHKEFARFLMDNEKKDQLLLEPRGHLKSHWMAMSACWELTKDPSLSIGYGSATESLAIAQLDLIKGIMESDRYRMLWPDMINIDVGKRKKWAATGIKVDHPKRLEERTRDDSIEAFGINANTTGKHFDVIYLDDVVVEHNANTEENRLKVASSYAQLSASVLNPGGRMKIAGTRYHEDDLYGILLKTPVNDEEQDEENAKLLYAVMSNVVESYGNYLWPRTFRSDGKAFGFDDTIISKIKTKYVASGQLRQFYAQYYNDPNAVEASSFSKTHFQYYDKKYLKKDGYTLYYKDKRLNVSAAVDFAFSLRDRADYTAMVVIGIDEDNYIYILDILRFKTKKVEDYAINILKLNEKWGIRRCRIEVTTAQTVICQYIKDEIRKTGARLSIEEYSPNRNDGTKEERIAATLIPLYENGTIWHYNGGFIPVLEEELLMANSPHDDCKDSLASAIEMARPPTKSSYNKPKFRPLIASSKFGGVA